MNSRLQGHPCSKTTPGVELSTGPLGLGLSAGIGMAIGEKLSGRDNMVYVLLGDGEIQEGIVWQAAMAGGLSTTGKTPFVNTFAAFMMLRGADPIRSNICYSGLNVKLAGAYAGLSDSYDGATHHALEDISFMRSMPNMTVISVCDPIETEKAVYTVAKMDGPVYLRLSRAEMSTIFDEDYNFEIGKGVVVKDGKDVAIVATGYMVHKALEARELLKEQNIEARVVNIHTIKPIDQELIIQCARETGAIVAAEEHNVHGGLGSAVAEVLAAYTPVPLEFVAVQDSFTESGDYEQLLEKYGLQAKDIVEKVKKAIKRK